MPPPAHDEIASPLGSMPKEERPSVTEEGQEAPSAPGKTRYQQIVNIIESYSEDEPLPPVAQIARTVGVDPGNVYPHLKRYRAETGRTLVHQRADSRYQEVVDYITAQPSLTDLPPVADIAATLNLPEPTLYAHLRKYKQDNGVWLRHRRKDSHYDTLVAYMEQRDEGTALPPAAEMAEELGIPITSLYRHLKTYEKRTQQKVEHEARERVHPKRDEIVRMLRAGNTHHRIQQVLHVSTNTVTQVRREIGATRQTSTEKVFDAIQRFHKAHGTAPTMAEIGRRLGMSSATVSYHVKALVEEGLVADPQGRTGLSLHGQAFRKDCLALARRTQRGEGVPQNLRSLVAALTYPVMAPDQRRLASKDPRQRTLAVIEHLCARDGRPVTPVALAEAMSCSTDAARWMLQQGEEFGTLFKQEVGWLPAGPDRQQAAGLRLRSATAQGWSPDAFETLGRVLRVVLAW